MNRLTVIGVTSLIVGDPPRRGWGRWRRYKGATLRGCAARGWARGRPVPADRCHHDAEYDLPRGKGCDPGGTAHDQGLSGARPVLRDLPDPAFPLQRTPDWNGAMRLGAPPIRVYLDRIVKPRIP